MTSGDLDEHQLGIATPIGMGGKPVTKLWPEFHTLILL